MRTSISVHRRPYSAPATGITTDSIWTSVLIHTEISGCLLTSVSNSGELQRPLRRRSPKVHLQTTEALFGPQFTLQRHNATAFGNILVGVTNTRLYGQAGTLYEDLIRQNSLTLGLGGGLDVNWTRLVAIRAFQVEYLPTRRSAWETTYTLTAGVVFRFGFR